MRLLLSIFPYIFGMILIIGCQKDSQFTQVKFKLANFEYSEIDAYNRYGNIANNNFHTTDLINDAFFKGNLINRILINSDNTASFKYDVSRFQSGLELISANLIVTYNNDSIFFDANKEVVPYYPISIFGVINGDSIVLKGAYFILSKGALGELSYEPINKQQIFNLCWPSGATNNDTLAIYNFRQLFKKYAP
jgi:hypothetical protein